MNIIIILFSSNFINILLSRIEISFNYILNNNQKTNFYVYWYLIKNNELINYNTEYNDIKIMQQIISNYYITNNYHFKYIIDEKSSNIEEKLITINCWLNNTSIKFDEIMITTSKYEYKNIKDKLENINKLYKYKWLLSYDEIN